MKTKSSYRSAPLTPYIEGLLRKEKEKQEEMKQVMRGGYCRDYDDYVNVDVIRRLYDPNYVSSHIDAQSKLATAAVITSALALDD